MTETEAAQNVRQAVPFFIVENMAASLRFYVDGLGFKITKAWRPDGPDTVRWCWLECGGAALMLQQSGTDGPHAAPETGKRGAGVTVCFMCADALAIYRETRTRGLTSSRPFVGNGLWVVSFIDPDGYRLEFESETDIPEDTQYDKGRHA